MRISHHSSWTAGPFVLALITLMAPAAKTQDQQSQGQGNQDQQSQGQQGQDQQNPDQSARPIPAYRSPLASAADNGDSDANGPQEPDTRALSGVQNFSLGLETTRSYWEPHVDVFGTADSNPLEQASGNSWGSWTSFSAGVDMRRTSGNSDLTLSYLGGALISSGAGSNGIVQGLAFTDKFTLRRWTVTFLDQANYMPESSFGYGGLGGSSLPSTGTSGAGSVFTPGQTLLTGQGQNVSDAFTTEADLSLTRRASITFVGGYSFVHYLDSDLLNSDSAIARVGYNYLLNHHDTIAALYTYNALRYGNFTQTIDEHTIQASYGRRVTGRLAFQIAAGPQIAVFHTPITVSGSGTSTTNSTELLWSLNAALQYQLRRIALALSYDHGVTAGSGVLAGSDTDTVSGSLTRQMSRTFSSGITSGYSRNKGLVVGTITPSSQLYNYYFVGAKLSYPWGRSLGITLSYQMQYQDSDTTFCIGPTCGTSVIRNLISVGVGWHERPLLF